MITDAARLVAAVLILCIITAASFIIGAGRVIEETHLRQNKLGVFNTRRSANRDMRQYFASYGRSEPASHINALFSKAVPTEDPRTELRTIHKLSLPLPLGLILEDMDMSNPSYGVVIVAISPDGNAAKLNENEFSDVSDSIGDRCICIRDKILSVNGTPCHDSSLDTVIKLISECNSDVTLELGRIQDSTIVTYSNGRCISAKAGESYGFLAQKCGVDIGYECRTGNCLTCSKWMEFPEKSTVDERTAGKLYKRTILHCVGTVPRNYEWLRILDVE